MNNLDQETIQKMYLDMGIEGKFNDPFNDFENWKSLLNNGNQQAQTFIEITSTTINNIDLGEDNGKLE